MGCRNRKMPRLATRPDARGPLMRTLIAVSARRRRAAPAAIARPRRRAPRRPRELRWPIRNQAGPQRAADTRMGWRRDLLRSRSLPMPEPRPRAAASPTQTPTPDPPQDGPGGSARQACSRSPSQRPRTRTQPPRGGCDHEGWPKRARAQPAGTRRAPRAVLGLGHAGGYDRDEYPQAVGRGRGAGLTAAATRRVGRPTCAYVPSHENRSHRVDDGHKLRGSARDEVPVVSTRSGHDKWRRDPRRWRMISAQATTARVYCAPAHQHEGTAAGRNRPAPKLPPRGGSVAALSARLSHKAG